MAYFDMFETSLGWMGFLASETGLRRTTLPRESPEVCYSLLGPEVEDATNERMSFEGIRARLDRHFEGEPDTFEDLPLDRCADFQDQLLRYVSSTHPDILQTIAESGDLTEEVEGRLTQAINDFKGSFGL